MSIEATTIVPEPPSKGNGLTLEKLFRVHRQNAKNAKKALSFFAVSSLPERLRGRNSRSLNNDTLEI
jgi:hypothetical protein